MRRWWTGLAVGLALANLHCASLEGAQRYSQGSRALDAGEFERAIADLERAAELVPQASEIQNHLGIAYSAAGREAEALVAFRRAVALDCRNDAARANLLAAEAEGSAHESVSAQKTEALP